MPGEVVHFEIPMDNAERARKFYELALGWKMQPMPEMNYTMVSTTPTDKDGMVLKPGAINGGMGKREGPLQHPVVVVMVPEITEAEKQIEKHGGKVVLKKQPIGDGSMGHMGYFKDTEGNVIGLYQAPKQ